MLPVRRPAQPAEQDEYRSAFLLSYPSAKFKAHWALFVPENGDRNTKRGRLIHVTGDVRNGFRLEFKRNYDLRLTKTRPEPPIEIGLVPAQYLDNFIGDGRNYTESNPRDAFDRQVATVPAPSKSLNNASDTPARHGPPRRVVLSDCQWWVILCVEALIQAGYLIPLKRGRDKGKSPLDILAAAPKH